MNKLRIIVASGLFTTFLSIPDATLSAFAVSDSSHIAYGDFTEGSIASLGKVDFYTFDGQVGEHVIIRVDPEGLNTGFRGMTELYGPADTLLISAWDSYTGGWPNYEHGGRQVSFVDFKLPQTGAYTLYVREDDGSHTSNYWLSLHSREHLRDHAVTIAFDTTLVSQSNAPVADIDAFRFSGQANERVILRVDPDGVNTGFRGMIELYGPADTLLISAWDSYTGGWPNYEHGGRQVSFVDFKLPQTGTYTLYVREDDGSHTSNYWLSLHSREHLRDNAVTIAFDTTLATQSNAPFGDIDAFRFSGQANERVILRVDPDGVNTGFRGTIELYGPADTLLISAWDSYTGGWPNYEHGGRQVNFVDFKLPQTGTYTLYVREDDGSHISNYWLSLHSREHLRDNAVTIAFDTTLATQSNAPFGDIDAFRFSGQANERVILRVDPDGVNTGFRGTIELYGPADTLLISAWDSYTGGWPNYEHGGRQVSFVDFKLPQTGAYTLYVREDDGSHTSKYWLSLHSRKHLHDHAVSIAFDTTLVSQSNAPVGDIDAFRFSGQANERVILRVDPDGVNTGFRGTIELYGPADTLLISAWDSYTGGWPNYEHGGRQVNFVDFKLPQTGAYTLYVREDDGSHISNYWLSLHSREHLRDHAVTIAFDTTLVNQSNAPVADIDAFRFSGRANERVILRVDPDGVNTGFRGTIELYGPADTLLISAWDSYTGGWPNYEHGGREVNIIGFVLPETGMYTFYVREDDGDHISNYWMKLQTAHPLVLNQPLENQRLTYNGDDKWFRVISNDLSAIVVKIEKVGNWNATLRVKKGSLPTQQPYFSDSGADNLETAFISAAADTYYIQVQSNSNGGQYSILATTDFTKVNKTLAIDNDVVNAQISIQRATVTSLLFEKGSNTELIASQWGSYLIDIGSDPRLGKYLNTGWSVQSAEVQPSYVSMSLSHTSGFANKLVLSWTNDHVEVRCDITAPEQVESHTVLRPGGGWESGRDKWAFPASAGLQTGSFSYPGNYRPLYPADNSWGTPSEGWLALWDDQVNEVVGFTFSGGFKAKVGNGAGADVQFLFPVGTSRLAFHVAKPKPVTPYEGIRDLASGPFLTLNNQVDKLFVSAGNELIYTLIYSNTGNQDATGTVIEDVLPSSLELVAESISDGGTYDAGTRQIVWRIDSLAAGAKTDTVTFKAKVTQEIVDGTLIVNLARIWATEQTVATSASVSSKVATPSIASVSPDKGGNTGAVTVTINGRHLDPNAQVKLTKVGEKDITPTFVTGSPDGIYLTAIFFLTGKSAGKWNLVVTNPNGNFANYEDGFILEDGGAPDLHVEVLGRTSLRVGRPNALRVRVENKGATDAWAYALWITPPPNCSIALDMPVIQDPLPGQAFVQKGHFDPTNNGVIISGHRLPVGTFEEFEINLIPNQPGQNEIIVEIFTSPVDSVFTMGSQKKLAKPLDLILVPYPSPAGGTWYPPNHEPPDGSIVIRMSKGGGSGHVGIYVGKGWVVDVVPTEKARPDGSVRGQWRRVNIHDKWHERNEDGEGLYVGAWAPPGLDKSAGERIKEQAEKMVGQSITFRVPSFFDNIDCVEGVYDVYKATNVNLPWWWIKREFLSPAEVYERSQGGWWPEYRGLGFFLAPSTWRAILYPWTPAGRVRIALEFLMAIDPNDKAGPTGYDMESTSQVNRKHFIAAMLEMPYIVYFENLDSATGAAQEILITDQLDSTLDWSTFTLGEMKIGEKTVSVPAGSKNFKTTADLRPILSTVVEVDFKFNPATGRTEWLLQGKDPYTGQLADFLPPNKKEIAPRGEGWVSFTVKPKQTLPTGTVIKNKATIDFEVNIPPAPMETPEVFNTIDADGPDSHVFPLAATQDSAHFRVRWTGTDIGAAIRDYTIFVSEESGPSTAWLINTPDTSAVFIGQPNKTYAFYSVARDNVGNVEDTPSEPDAKTRAGLLTSAPGNDDDLPKTFTLSQNYPNPFNPTTSIRIEVPKPAHVTIKIYDILGREVRMLVDRKFEAGGFVEIWDGTNNNRSRVASGLYFMRMQAEGFVSVKKLLMLK